MFSFAPDALGTMALGAKVKMGDKLKKLSVFSESSVRDRNLCVLCVSNERSEWAVRY
jgi:hypothetical protein